MTNDTVIKVENVSKKYCRELKHTMLYGIQDISKNAIGLSSHSERLRDGEFWALDDVSFEIKKEKPSALSVQMVQAKPRF